MVMLPEVCISGGENLTTVLAHLPSMGLATKSHDLLASWACHACHQHIDGAVGHNFDYNFLREKHNEGVIRTQRYLLENKVISV